MLVPAPWTRTIEQLVSDGVRGDVYAHEQITVPQGTARDFLEVVHDEATAAFEKFGWELIGAWHTAMVNENEAFLLWSIPTFAQWGEAEGAQRTDPALAKWRDRSLRALHRLSTGSSWSTRRCRPCALGRQPARSDREAGWEDL